MIEKGKEWGRAVSLVGDEPLVNNDAAVAALLAAGEERLILVGGGDLFRSLGGQAPPTPYELPIDRLDVTADGARHVAAAHVVARRPLWAGEFVVAMNGTHLGGWNLGPKAHPNDGIVDITMGSLSLSDRLKARKRAPAGAHVPHPDLATKRVRTFEHTFARPTPLYIDGRPAGRVRHLEIAVVPDSGRIALTNETGA